MKVRGLYPNEQALINELLKSFYDNGFGEAIRPTIIEVDDEPITSIQQSKIDSHELDTDELLGIYDSKHQEIKLYTKCIEAVAKELSVSEQDLKDVVLLHEFGHWITHKLPYGDQKEWRNYSCNSINHDVHEGWAQLITWWAVKDAPILADVFSKLNENQSTPYRIWKQHQNSSIIALLLLRENDCPLASNAQWSEFDKTISADTTCSFEKLKINLRGLLLAIPLGNL